MERTAMLFGASSQAGAELLPLLLGSEEYSGVTILVRTLLPIQHAKLQQFEVDFDDEGAYTKLLSGDDIYYCMGCGTSDKEVFEKVELDYSLRIAGEALRNGAKQFIYLSAYGADVHSRIFYLEIKGRAEQALSSLGYRAIHIFRPSMLSGNKDHERLSQRVFARISRFFGFLFLGPLKNLKTLKAKTLAEGMVNVALAGLQGVHYYKTEQIRQKAGRTVPTVKIEH